MGFLPVVAGNSGMTMVGAEFVLGAEKRMKLGGRHPKAKVENMTESNYPGLRVDLKSPALELARRLLGRDDWTTAPYGADAGYFQQAGIPSALAGPEDIAQAHKPDEFIEIAELEKCAAFFGRAVRGFGGGVGGIWAGMFFSGKI